MILLEDSITKYIYIYIYICVTFHWVKFYTFRVVYIFFRTLFEYFHIPIYQRGRIQTTPTLVVRFHDGYRQSEIPVRDTYINIVRYLLIN